MSGPLGVGQKIEGWEIVEVQREGALPRYGVKSAQGSGTLSYYPLKGDRATLHRGMLARAKTASGLKHPNFIRTPVGEAGAGAIAIVPDVDRLGEEPIPAEEALNVIERIAQALAVFHAQGRAHGEVDLFSVAKRGGEAVLLSPGLRPGPPELTSLRIAVDPRYASPEVLDAQAPTPASDVFSLGLVLYSLITGQPTVSAAPPVDAVVARGQNGVPDIAKGRPLSAGVTSLYANMTAAYPQRPQNAQALLQAIARARKGALPAPTRLKAELKRQTVGGLLVVVALLVAAVGGGAYYLQNMFTVSSPADGFAFEVPKSE
jgi:hypothetical protein